MIYLRLYSSLTKYLKATSAGEPVALDMDAGRSVSDLISSLGIGEEEVFLVSVNGKIEDRGYVLPESADVSLFGPIAGGASTHSGKPATVAKPATANSRSRSPG